MGSTYGADASITGSLAVDGDIDFYFSNNFEPIALNWSDCTLTKIEHVKDGE